MKEAEIRYGEAIVATVEKTIVYVDDTLCSLLGYELEEMTGTNGTLRLLGEQYASEITQMLEIITQKGYMVKEYSVMTKSEKSIRMICHGTVFFDGRGKIHLRMLWTMAGYLPRSRRNKEYDRGLVHAEKQEMHYIIDSIDQPVYVVSRQDYKLLYCNDAFNDFRPQGAVGKYCYKCLHDIDEPCEECIIHKLETEDIQSADTVFFDEGYKQSVNLSAANIEWEGEPAAIIMVRNMKLTPEELERKRRRQRLTRNLATLFKDNYDLITEIKIRTGEYVVMSRDIDYPHAIAPSGDYREQEKILMEYVAFPVDKDKIAETIGYDSMLKAFDSGVRTVECKFRMYEDNHVRWKHVTAYYVKDEQEPLIILTTVDITEEMCEEEKTFTDRRNLLQAVSNIYFSIVYADLSRDSYHILKTDDDTPALLLKGNFNDYLDTVTEKIHPADRKQFRDTFDRRNMLDTIRQNRQTRFYCEVRELNEKEQYRYVRIEGVVLDQDTTDYVQMMLLYSDITQNKVDEEENRRALQTAESLNSAKTKILTRMSQEVYESVNDIVNQADRQLEGLSVQEGMESGMGQIRENAMQVCDDLRDILDIARMESHNMVVCEEDFTIRRLIEEIEDEIGDRATKNGVAFQLLEKGLTKETYHADFQHLRQILMELLSNAIKYSDAGGKVTLFVKHAKSSGKDKDVFDFIVEDEGIGMEEAVVNKMHVLFEKEQPADSRFVCGAGLSLTIVKNLVFLLGGNIRVRSARGQGTTFHINIELPKSNMLRYIDEKEQSLDMLAGGNLEGKRILLVEDNRLNQDMAMTLLELKDMRIECANHGKEAYDLFEMSEEGYYDLILMDAQMPFQNGFETTMALREMQREDAKTVPVIAMLESRADYEVSRVEKAGMNDYLVKPLESQTLISMIEKYC